MAKPRDYKDEYNKFHKSTKSKKDRASRNKVRRLAIAQGKVQKGDKSKEVDHKDGNPRNNSKRNLRIVDRSTNRRKK